MDKRRMIHQLNQHAHQYDQHAIIQKKMAYALLASLRTIGLSPQQIMEWGCGTGFLTQLITRSYPASHVIAMDLSEKMIQLAKEKLGSSPAVQLLHTDIETVDWSPWSPFDLIVSNSVLHWLLMPVELFRRAYEALTPGGWFVHTLLGPDTFQELAATFHRIEESRALPLEQHQLLFRSVSTWEEMSVQAGFINLSIREHWQRFEYRDCYVFLQAIKAIGASYSRSRQDFSTSDQVLREVIHRYNRAYRYKDGVYATYHMIHLAAQKPF